MWKHFEMVVSKKVEGADGKGEYQEVGRQTVHYPLLDELGIKAEPQSFDEDEGFPIYGDERLDWMFGAVLNSVKMQARNKLISGTAELKEGQKIADDWESLLASADRVGNGAFLKLRAEINKAFAAFVRGLGKTPEIAAFIAGLFANKNSLALQNETVKGKMSRYIEDFAKGLEPEDSARFEKYLLQVIEVCGKTIDVEGM